MATQAVKLDAAKVESDVKEVSMDVAAMEGGGAGGKTRRRRRGSRRQRGGAAGEETVSAVVEKEGAPVATKPVQNSQPPAPTTQTSQTNQSQTPTPVPSQAGGAKKVPVVVIAPPKKKAPKVTLVPKVAGKRAPVKKTFKAKRVRVLIKNRKTVKRQQQALQKVETMSETEVRTAAVAAGLTRQDANAPVALLRTMLRDYQTMRGGFL